MGIYSKNFATYYDQLMGDYSHLSTPIQQLIHTYASSKSHLRVLELACGTGTILKTLPKSYEVYGLDIAKDMVAIAKEKVPYGKFVVGDMTDFSFSQKFDIILCVFDSINHLTNFHQWESVFRLAAKHLTETGVFIFDMNTPKRLARITTFPPVIKKLDKTTLAFEKLSQKNSYTYALQIVIVEKLHTSHPIVSEEIVEETVFETKKVIQALEKYFSIEKMLDPFRKRITKNTGRIFFVCKKRTI